MSLPFTSVVSYHTNPMTCGVANFSSQLAKRLGVPMVPLSPDPDAWGSYPLLSLKWSELTPDHRVYTQHHCSPLPDQSSAEVLRTAQSKTCGVFWHDAGDAHVTAHAAHVMYADPSLGSPGLWCPSLITPRDRPVRLFSFGMAGKLQPDCYRRVRDLLDAAGKRYHLRVSVGLHEGTSLDRVERHFDALKDIMGPEHVTILGILSDDAVSDELDRADYVLAFFEGGAKLNNTTIHAAIEAGTPVITNGRMELWGASSLDDMQQWPRSAHFYNWDNLLSRMTDLCVPLPSTVV